MTWADAGSGDVMVAIGDLAVGEEVTLVYTYTSTEADDGQLITNTAVSEGTVTATLPNPEPMTITSEPSEASIMVDEIPLTGEAADNAALLGGGTLLMAGAAALAMKKTP